MSFLPRRAGQLVQDALDDTPVVTVQGPRQAGKTTLVETFVGRGNLQSLVTLDDLDVRAAAAGDPQGFVAGLGDGAVIDEIQRVPDLILAIKASVDRDRRSGRFLLTGSANPFHRHQETLAGRREDVALWPFAQAELERTHGPPIDGLFGSDPGSTLRGCAPVTPADVVARALKGGFPDVLDRTRPERIQAWFRGYVSEVVRNEVSELAAIEGLLDMPKLLRLVAHRSTGLLNVARLARDADLPPQTTRRYLALLTETFLVMTIPAWARGGRKRLVKSPKIVITDGGLSAYLGDLTPQRLERSPELAGMLLEGFALTELRKVVDWSTTRPSVHHFRTDQGHEVDAVLEDRGGRVIGIEVRSRVTITSRDFRGLDALATVAGSRFHLGIVLHPGSQIIPFGENRWAVPFSLLWT